MVQTRHPAARFAYAAMTAARLVLGLGIMGYGIDKLFDLQFTVPASTYAQQLGVIPGSALVWATFGYAPMFQALLGLFELVPALLLLNVRTRRLGTLLMFPALLNIMLINFFLDLWPGTKAISSTMFALNLFLIAYDRRLYRDLLARLFVVDRPAARERSWPVAKIAGITVSIAGLVLWSAAFGFSAIHLQKPVSDLTGFPQINAKGSWRVESLTIANKAVTVSPGTSFFFNVFNTCSYGNPRRQTFCTFDADKTHRTFKIRQLAIEGSAASISGTYQIQNDRLRLDGNRDGQPISFVLSRLQYRPETELSKN